MVVGEAVPPEVACPVEASSLVAAVVSEVVSDVPPDVVSVLSVVSDDNTVFFARAAVDVVEEEVMVLVELDVSPVGEEVELEDVVEGSELISAVEASTRTVEDADDELLVVEVVVSAASVPEVVPSAVVPSVVVALELTGLSVEVVVSVDPSAVVAVVAAEEVSLEFEEASSSSVAALTLAPTFKAAAEVAASEDDTFSVVVGEEVFSVVVGEEVSAVCVDVSGVLVEVSASVVEVSSPAGLDVSALEVVVPVLVVSVAAVLGKIEELEWVVVVLLEVVGDVSSSTVCLFSEVRSILNGLVENKVNGLNKGVSVEEVCDEEVGVGDTSSSFDLLLEADS